MRWLLSTPRRRRASVERRAVSPVEAAAGDAAWTDRRIHLVGTRAAADTAVAGFEEAGWLVMSVEHLPDHRYEVWEVHVAVPRYARAVEHP